MLQALNLQLKLTKEMSGTQKLLISSDFVAYPLTCPFSISYSFHYQTIKTAREKNNISNFLWMIDLTI